LTQYATTVSEQLLADGSHAQAASNTVKKIEAQLLLEIADLPREGRLANAQAQRRLGNRAQFGYGDERSQALEIHILPYPQIA
jgi:hypothetical protein